MRVWLRRTDLGGNLQGDSSLWCHFLSQWCPNCARSRSVPLIIDRKPLAKADELLRFSVDGDEQFVRPKAGEAIVWVSVTQRNPRNTRLVRVTAPGSRPWPSVFPVLIDSGCSESFFAHDWHFLKWITLPPETFKAAGKGRVLYNCCCPMVLLDLWVHPFRSVTSGPPTDLEQAIKLQIEGGVVSTMKSSVLQQGQAAPRSKLSGMWDAITSFFRGKKERDDAPVEWMKSILGGERHRDSIPMETYPRWPVLGLKALLDNKLKFSIDGRGGTFSLGH